VLKYLLSAVAVAGIALGVPQFQKWEHRREGETKYQSAVADYQHAYNAALQTHQLKQAQIDAERESAIKAAKIARDGVFAEIRRDYPEVSIK
jgi:hypothetical protein